MTHVSNHNEARRDYHRAARQTVETALDGLRPASPQLEASGASRMVLVDRGEGALSWQDPDAAPVPPVVREAMLSPSTLIEIPNEILGPNQILTRLKTWDNRLTPNQGLRRWNPDDGSLRSIASVPAIEHPAEKPGGILLVIHGTFSTGDAIFEQLASIEPDSAFLSWASSRYEHVLSFDHATLSVSPILNGLDLARLFADVSASVDVICHSRGGLVARWWLEAFGGAKVGPRRVVFVSSPLGGTSLASPSKIREAFDLFTTVGAHLKLVGSTASVFLPFTMVAVALLQVFQVVTGSLAKTAASDLFFAAIPGLGSMSRVGNSGELERLRNHAHALTEYFAIRSDFRMQTAGWRFWKNFDEPSLRASQWGADRVFSQENDLVVDNRSTSEIFDGQGLAPERIKHFASNGEIHHTNYFTHREVTETLRTFLT